MRLPLTENEIDLVITALEKFMICIVMDNEDNDEYSIGRVNKRREQLRELLTDLIGERSDARRI